MSDSLGWTPFFYHENNGTRPAEEFIESLPTRDQKRIVVAIDKACERNVNARAPLVRRLKGVKENLWRLRADGESNTYRLIYFVSPDRLMVLLHGFQKKTQEIPRREIMTALRRYKNHLQRS